MRYFAITALLILVAACGFSPVYGTKSVSQSFSNIDVAIIPNREGQMLRNHLIDVLYGSGYPARPDYQLIISPIKENIFEIGIDRDDEASRAQLRLSANMKLRDLNDNKVVLNRTVRTTTGYNILVGQFTTYITENDAREQSLKALSDNIVTQLELYFK